MADRRYIRRDGGIVVGYGREVVMMVAMMAMFVMVMRLVMVMAVAVAVAVARRLSMLLVRRLVMIVVMRVMRLVVMMVVMVMLLGRGVVVVDGDHLRVLVVVMVLRHVDPKVVAGEGKSHG